MTLPQAPGSAQQPPTAQEMLAYLGQLGDWVTACRNDLDRIDQKVQSVNPVQGVQDVAMTLTVWQAIDHRYTDLMNAWDSGRVTDVDLRKLGVMIWSDLNDQLTPGTTLGNGGGLALSLPEACRMLEALISQLSARYQLADVPTEASTRIAALRAQLERIRNQAALDPPAVQQITQPTVSALAADITNLVDAADRGADVGGILGPLEVRAARLERDLIVGHAERQMLAGQIQQAQSRRAGLVAREREVTELAVRTREAVTPAPKYAVPRIEALGEVPTTTAELNAYLARLDQAGKALDVVQQANLRALAHKSDLALRLEKAEAGKTGNDPLATSLNTQIRQLLQQNPAPLAVVEPLIAAYEAAEVPA